MSVFNIHKVFSFLDYRRILLLVKCEHIMLQMLVAVSFKGAYKLGVIYSYAVLGLLFLRTLHGNLVCFMQIRECL